MSFEYKKGNLLTSNCEYICHQVNCQGVMGRNHLGKFLMQVRNEIKKGEL